MLSRALLYRSVLALIGSQMQSNAIKSGQSQANQAIQQGVTTATNQLRRGATTGVPANADQADLLGLNGQPAADAAMAKFQQSPGYQWQLGQGLRAVDAGAASQGILRSGATIKGEETFGQGLANTDFGNYWNRLQQLSGSGLDAAKGIASAATGGAQNIASDRTRRGRRNRTSSATRRAASAPRPMGYSTTRASRATSAAGGGGASTYAGMARRSIMGWI